METIDKELVTINTRAQQIADEAGRTDIQYDKIEKWLEEIKKATQSINNKIKTK